MTRRGRRRAPELETAKSGPDYRHLRHPFRPQAIFSDDQVAAIHESALEVLERLGMRILLDEARALLVGAGASMHGEMVRIGRDMVVAALASAPPGFTIGAPNPDRAQRFEEGAMIFSPGAGCPNASDRSRGRRPGTLSDYRDTLKLAQSFDVIHLLAPMVEPQDVPVHLRHYDQIESQLALSDKPIWVYGRGRAQVEDCFAMIRQGLALDEAAFTGGVWCTTVVNTNSPRMIDRPMAQALIDFARAGQMVIVTPFCLAGAMAPVTVAGALVLQHAEALAAITVNQLARPGAPVAYGGFGSNVDMKSGAPAFGTPEHVQMTLGSGQLARHVGLPWRSAAGTAANAPDMQAGIETQMSLWAAALANATVTLHTAGWLEGGLTFGYEKFINDIEGLQMIAHLASQPARAGEAARAMVALEDVQPGGHFFGTPHTLERYRDAFYSPLVADLSNFGTWSEAGAAPADVRATAIWQEVLAGFAPPPGAAERAGRIAGFIARRKAEGGAPILD